MSNPNSGTGEREYVLGTHDEEIDRLGLQHRAWRASTYALWDHAGFGPGQTLEIDQGPPRGRVQGVPGRRSLLRASCDGKLVQVEGRVREVLRGDVALCIQ